MQSRRPCVYPAAASSAAKRGKSFKTSQIFELEAEEGSESGSDSETQSEASDHGSDAPYKQMGQPRVGDSLIAASPKKGKVL